MFSSIGLTYVWTSPVIPKLLSNDTEINPLGSPITILQISTISAMASVGLTIALILMTKLTNYFGRTKWMFILAINLVAAFNIMAFANHVYAYVICLFIVGLSLGGLYINVPLYITEIADDRTRGKLGCFLTLSASCGHLFGYIVGPPTSVQWFTWICCTPALLHLLLCRMLEESPVYLVSKNEKEKALKALGKLRNQKNYSKLELEYIKLEEFVKHDSTTKKASFFDLFRTRTSRKGFFLCFTVCMSMQTCGLTIISSFTGIIFNEANNSISGNTIGIILGFVQISTHLLATYCVDKLGRRQLLLLSTFGCSCLMLILGIYFFLQQIESPWVLYLRWLPVLGVILFIVSYAFGIGPLPLLLIGELLPCDLRPVGMATIFISEASMASIVMACFPLIKSRYGIHCAMWIHSFCNVISFSIIYFFLPETKCKSFKEIEKLLGK